MKIVITGISGFVGSQLAMHWLMTNPSAEVVGVFNAMTETEALQKQNRLLDHWRKQCNFVPDDRFKSMSWSKFIESESEVLADSALLFHTAASTDFDNSIDTAREANVRTTHLVLTRARQINGLKRFIHVSTAFVVARERGVVSETAIPKEFNNTYEQSKYESEIAVRLSGLPYTIVRPSIIVGDSRNGYAKHFRVFYSMFRLWLSGVVPRAPLDLAARADVVPIDFVCSMLQRLATDERAIGKAVNVCAGMSSPNVGNIFLTWIEIFKQEPPRFSPPVMLKLLSHPLFAPLVPDSLSEVLRLLRGHFPYIGSRVRTFSSTLTEGWYGADGVSPKFEDYGKSIFGYCLSTRWGKLPRSERRGA